MYFEISPLNFIKNLKSQVQYPTAANKKYFQLLRPSLVDVVEMGGNLEFTASVVETTTCIDVNGSVKKKETLHV